MQRTVTIEITCSDDLREGAAKPELSMAVLFSPSVPLNPQASILGSLVIAVHCMIETHFGQHEFAIAMTPEQHAAAEAELADGAHEVAVRLADPEPLVRLT